MIAFLLRRFRWMLVGAGVKYVARRGVGRSVDEAATQLEERLPAPVATAMNALPGDMMRASGAAMVSARAAQRGALAAHRGARLGGTVVSRVTRPGAVKPPRPALADRLRDAREAITDQAERDGRELRADFQRFAHGGGPEGERAAVDALLDRRDRIGDRPLPTVPEPIGRGRRRSVPYARAEVARMQRTYRRPEKPWDRTRRGRTGSES